MNTFGSQSCTKKEFELVQLDLHLKNEEKLRIHALDYETICLPLESKIDITSYPHLYNLELADFNEDTDSETIDVLIGSDYYWDLIIGDVIRGDSGPVALSSKLGWIISGKITNQGENQHF